MTSIQGYVSLNPFAPVSLLAARVPRYGMITSERDVEPGNHIVDRVISRAI